MKYTYMGLIEFPEEILISGEILGKQYITQIGNINILIKMPVIGRKDNLHENLETPFSGFDFEINWGYVVHSETKDSFIKAAIALFQAEEEQAQLVYSSFPSWLYRFMVFVRASSHDLVKEFVTTPFRVGSEGRADKYTGICLYKMINCKREYEYNSDKVLIVHLDDSQIYNVTAINF